MNKALVLLLLGGCNSHVNETTSAKISRLCHEQFDDVSIVAETNCEVEASLNTLNKRIIIRQEQVDNDVN